MRQLIIFIGFLFVVKISAAQFDSTAILQQHATLRTNISSYNNQPFSVLYNALSIKPTVVTGFNPHFNKNVEWATQFHYANPNDPKYVKYYIDVEWETPIPTSETLQYQDKIRRNFNAQEYSIYTNKVVKKVQFFPDPMVDAGGVLMKKKPEVKPAKKK